MSIDWEDGQNKKAFRKTILAVYPNRTDLAVFLSDELSLSLNAISNEGNLTNDVFNLIEHLESNGKTQLFYDVFCSENSDNPKIVAFKREIEGSNLTPTQVADIEAADWIQLHSLFTIDNLPEVSRAFLEAFEASFGRSFHRVYADRDPFNFDQIYQTLEDLDDPKLTAAFAHGALTRIRTENNTTNGQITQLTQWRDRLLARHNLTLSDIQPPDTTSKQGYLLVSLEENPKKTQKDGVFVNVFAELRVVGQDNPEPFGGTSTTCSLDKVAAHLCELIHKAEQAIENKITLELFLPCAHIEHDVASWELVNESQDLGVLGNYRPYLLRSLERAKNKVSQTCISGKWKQLKDGVAESNPGLGFHPQDTCPGRSELEGLLDDAPGLLLTAELPSNLVQRRRIISDIVNAAVPIALWFTEVEESSATERQTAFETLLQAGCVTDFAPQLGGVHGDSDGAC